jgi:hypothetical protein
MHQKIPILLVATAVILLICIPVSMAAAENSEPRLLSGYVLDSNGHGIEGATVKLIYGSPYYPQNITDVSGYFEFQGWANAPVKLCIYPPNGTSFVDYTNESFTIQPDMTANCTLTRGYTLSGSVLDQNDNPITGEVYLDGHWSGQWSNSSTGYFYVSAPAGTYTVRVLGGASHWGSSSFEYEVLNKTITLDNDVIGNIIVKEPEPTPTVPEFSGLMILALTIAVAAMLICAKKIQSRNS